MPKLPDIYDLGQRPTPVNRRQIAQTPRVGAVGEAVAGLGSEIAQIGQQKLEAQDKLSYAKAKAHLLREDIAARQELEKDPAGYATWESRYGERMKKARGDAAKLIQHRGDRVTFDLDADLDVQRGLGEVQRGARVKLIDAEVSNLNSQLDALQDVGIDAGDDATRESAIRTSADLIEGARQQGFISAEAAQNKRRAWTQSYVVQRYEFLKRGGDLDGAEKWYAANRSRLDPEADMSIGNGLADAKEDRFVLGKANEYVRGIPLPETGASPAQFSDPLRGRGGKPVKGGQFGAPRDGGSRAHGGVDFTGARGTPVMSGAGAGTARVSRSAKGGNIVTIDHGNGVVTKYMHLDTVNVKDGQKVTADTVIGGLGNTGKSSGPHLHYEAFVNGKRVDPTSLAGSRTSIPSRGELPNIYRQIEADGAKEGWTPEMIEKVKSQAARELERENSAKEAAWRDAGREASIVIANTPNLTDITQIPRHIRERMDPVDLAELDAKLRDARIKAAETKPKGPRATELEILRRTNPQAFASLDLTKDVGKVTDDELRGFILQQADIIGKPDQGPNYREGINSAITWGKKYNGVEIKDDDFPAVYDIMDGYIAKIATTRPPTKADYDDAFKAATREVKIIDGGWAWFDSKEPLYQIEYDEIPDNVVNDIRKAWRGPKPPTKDEILRIFRQRFTGRIK